MNYQKSFHFFSKRSKRSKRLTKHQILRNILPFYDSVGISRKQHGFRNYAETYNVKAVNRISLSDSLYLAKVVLLIYLKIFEKKKEVLNTFYQ